MKTLSIVFLFLLSSSFFLKAHENGWNGPIRSVPPISSVIMDGYDLCIHFDFSVDTMLLQVWDANGEEVHAECVVCPPVGDYYVTLDNLLPGDYTFRLSMGSGYWAGDFSK